MSYEIVTKVVTWGVVKVVIGYESVKELQKRYKMAPEDGIGIAVSVLLEDLVEHAGEPQSRHLAK